MSKEKYQIGRKADYICLTILLHDLSCFNEDLALPNTDIDSLVFKLRNTRNVFISLHNLKDAMNNMRIDGDEKFISETRLLRRKLEFINHVRNKSVGHLDRSLLERAAQWAPQIFYDNKKTDRKYLAFESYRAVLESSINSYLDQDGQQKAFQAEIDFLYPPDAKQFYEFLSDVVLTAITWLKNAQEIVTSEINFHSEDAIIELAAIAGKTNFDLKADVDLMYSEDELVPTMNNAIEKIREMGADDKIIEFLEAEFIK